MRTALFVLLLCGTRGLEGAETPAVRAARFEQQAETEVSQGHFAEAISDYQSALALDPSSEKSCLGLALAYKQVFNYDQARSLLNECSRKHPKSGAALVELGDMDVKGLHYEQAVEELKQAVTRSPLSALAHLELGVAYHAKGDSASALAEFNRVIQIDPKLASAYYFRAEVYAEGDDNVRAESDARKALSLEPHVDASRVLLGKVLTRNGKCSEAAELLRPVATPAADPKNLYELARAYRCSHQPELASATQLAFEERTKQDQERKTQHMEADHLAVQASEAARQNQLAAALDLLQQALTKDPGNGRALALQSKIDFSRGQVKDAHDAINSALRTDPYNPDYLYVLGKILEKEQDMAGALAAFQQTVLVNPQESDAYFEMSQIYLQAGSRAKAIEAMQNAVKHSPDDPDYRKALTQLQSGKPSSNNN